MDDQEHPVDEPVEAGGRAQAEAFDAELRRIEERELIERLTCLAAGEGGWTDGGAEATTPTEVARLQDRVEELTAFRQAVLDSRPWRLIQAVRRVFGRDW